MFLLDLVELTEKPTTSLWQDSDAVRAAMSPHLSAIPKTLRMR